MRPPDGEHVRPLMEATFREYGLPQVIRSDNGPPFATVAVHGLSALAVWWIKLGIYPERIEPGHPEQNGRHERMHRTLKEETVSPPEKTMRAQQRAFDRFQQEYNEERPHQGLELKTPAECYAGSPQPYPSRIEEPEYPADYEVRRVANGQIRWRIQKVFVGKGLNGERIGLEQIGDGLWRVWFSFYELGELNEREGRLLPRPEPAGEVGSSGAGADSGRPRAPSRPAPPRTKSVTYVLGLNCYLCPGLLKATLRFTACCARSFCTSRRPKKACAIWWPGRWIARCAAWRTMPTRGLIASSNRFCRTRRSWRRRKA